MILNRMTIGNRLMVSVLFAALLPLAIGVFGGWRVMDEMSDHPSVTIETNQDTAKLSPLTGTLYEMESALKDVVLAHRKEDVENAQSKMNILHMRVTKELEGLEGAQALTRSLETWKKTSDSLVLHLLEGQRLNAEALLTGEVADLGVQIRKEGKKLQMGVKQAMEQAASLPEKKRRKYALLMNGMKAFLPYGVGMLVCLLGGLLIVRRQLSHGLIRPLNGVTNRLDLISQGDLTGEPFEVRLGAPFDSMKTAVNRVQSRLTALESTVQGHTEALSAASYALTATAETQQKGAGHQVSASEEVQTTLSALLKSASEVTEVSQRVFNHAESTQHNTQAMSNTVDSLGVHSKQFSGLVSVMKDIGSRSDLLALNASLEGTKAGVVGRRFAFIAARMQRLSDQIVENVKRMDVLAEQMTESVQSGLVAAEEAVTTSKDATYSARRITLAVQQQKEGTEQILATAIGNVGEARACVDTAHQVIAASEHVNELAETLNQSLLTLDL